MSPTPKGKAILYDAEKCIGCRACEVACHEWNKLPADDTEFSPDYSNPRYVTPRSWTTITYHELGGGNGKPPLWVYVKIQCFHCLTPTCATVCPTKAIHIDAATGAVVWDPAKCIGCKYCIEACPFDIPRLDPATNRIVKCTMCVDRVQHGIPPACVQACPTGALYFDDYEKVKMKAEQLASKGRYVYGLKEVGGTRFMIALPKGVKPEDVGLPTPKTKKPAYALASVTSEDYWSHVGVLMGEWAGVGVVGSLILAGLWWREKRIKEKTSGGERK